MRSVIEFFVVIGVLLAGSLMLSGVIASDTPLKFIVPFGPALIFWYCRRIVLQSLGV